MRAHPQPLRPSLAAILLGFSLTIPAAAHTLDTRATSAPIARPAIRIDNFGEVNANYFRGAQPQGRDYADLAALGVKTVIDLRR